MPAANARWNQKGFNNSFGLMRVQNLTLTKYIVKFSCIKCNLNIKNPTISQHFFLTLRSIDQHFFLTLRSIGKNFSKLKRFLYFDLSTAVNTHNKLSRNVTKTGNIFQSEWGNCEDRGQPILAFDPSLKSVRQGLQPF